LIYSARLLGGKRKGVGPDLPLAAVTVEGKKNGVPQSGSLSRCFVSEKGERKKESTLEANLPWAAPSMGKKEEGEKKAVQQSTNSSLASVNHHDEGGRKKKEKDPLFYSYF